MKPAYELSYDGEADALYLGVQSDFIGLATTLSGGPGLNVDCVDGEVVGIEVLNASRHPLFGALLPKVSGGVLTSVKSGYRVATGEPPVTNRVRLHDR